MGRQRDPKRDKAFEMWKSSDGKMNLVDIASALGVPEGTVRGWKAKDRWDDRLSGKTVPERSEKHQKKERSAPKNKTERSNNSERSKKEKEQSERDFNFEIENDGLTDKQRLFCIYYVKYWNAGKAAKKAGYNCSYPNGFYEIGCQLLKNPQVKEEIDRIKKSIVDNIAIEAMAVFQKYIDIAFSDITDYVKFGQRQEQVIGAFGPVYEGKGKDKKPVMQTVNYIDLSESSEVDGSLITEVKQGKDGISIKLADKMRALEFLTKYFDLLPDHHKRRIEEERLKIDRERLELDKKKAAGEGDVDSELVDDWAEAVMNYSDEE